MTIPPDKWLHFAAGQMVSLLALTPVVYSGGAWWIPAAAAGVVGIAKEGYDYLHRDRHTADMLDALWTALGGLPVATTLWASKLG